MSEKLKLMRARYESACLGCGKRIKPGYYIYYGDKPTRIYHGNCAPREERETPEETNRRNYPILPN